MTNQTIHRTLFASLCQPASPGIGWCVPASNCAMGWHSCRVRTTEAEAKPKRQSQCHEGQRQGMEVTRAIQSPKTCTPDNIASTLNTLANTPEPQRNMLVSHRNTPAHDSRTLTQTCAGQANDASGAIEPECTSTRKMTHQHHENPTLVCQHHNRIQQNMFHEVLHAFAGQARPNEAD